jgi:transcriptional regulator with XRE-family HTH domain
MSRIHNYLKLYRKRWRLTQDEFGLLLGIKSRRVVSRLENGERPPSMKEMFACEVILGESPSTLFPGYYQSIEDAVMRRAAAFSAKLEARTSTAAAEKRKLLQSMIGRASSFGKA